MAKFAGEVGYGVSLETPPGSGVWKDQITEQSYFGDIDRETRQLTEGPNVNKNITVSNSISIMADQFAIENFANIRYVRWNGSLWTVTNVEVQRPRLILSLGSVYDGPTP